MRTKVSNHEVARLWAAQFQSHAGNSAGSIWFEDDTIYSYGRHFPIARLTKGAVLFNCRTYSITTTSHQSEVYRALGFCLMFSVPYVKANSLADHKSNHAHICAEAYISEKKAKRARLNYSKACHSTQAALLRQQATEYARLFDLD